LLPYIFPKIIKPPHVKFVMCAITKLIETHNVSWDIIQSCFNPDFTTPELS
jgi:hypothetical protein